MLWSYMCKPTQEKKQGSWKEFVCSERGNVATCAEMLLGARKKPILQKRLIKARLQVTRGMLRKERFSVILCLTMRKKDF